MARIAALSLWVTAVVVGAGLGGAAAQPVEAAKPAVKADVPSPRLLPWRERVGPYNLAQAIAFEYTIAHALDLAVEMKPEMAEQVRAAREARARLFGAGLAAIEARAVASGQKLDEVKRQVSTPERDAKLKAAIEQSVSGVVAGVSRFDNAPEEDSPDCLLYAFGQKDETYDRTISQRLLIDWSGGFADAKGGLRASLQLPAGWCSMPTKGKTLFRAVSQAGFGDDMVTVFVDAIDTPLNEQQQEGFWKLMHGREQYEKSGGELLELKDTKLGTLRAMEVMTSTKAEPKGWFSRATIRQVMTLRGRWVVTVQLMSSTASKDAAGLLSAAQAAAAFRRLDPVWAKMVASLEIEDAPALPVAKPSDEKPAASAR